jgi:pyridinium-3,5-bisthiocarboxylic acid mononucleotide nickel chelatase
MGQVMYLDCFSGAAGDMVLAALLDAGLPEAALREALGTLGAGHEISITRVVRGGIAATHFNVASAEPEHAHPHVPPHDPHARHADDGGHRSLAQIVDLIRTSSLSAAGKDRATAMFGRLAAAEAAIHDLPIEAVHLHEVGAVDSIIDIVGAVFAMEWFGIDDVVASPLNVGGGTVRIAHGTFPVPAPATLRLLAGAPIYSSGIPFELVTPTGALVVTTYVREYGRVPPMTVRTVGYGAGTRELDGTPNVLRVVIGDRTAAETAPGAVVEIACEIDDMNPQLFGPVMDALFAAGALDVFLTPVMMKKSRPGTLLTVLAAPGTRDTLTTILFRETTTIGVRYREVQRDVLDRATATVDLPGGQIRIKVASRGGEVLNAVPEFDDCVRVAAASGQPVKLVQAEALRVWLSRNSP